MSKRLTRIHSGQLFSALSNLHLHQINAVFSNGNTLFGKLVSLNSDHLVLKDTRDHDHKVQFSDLYEIVYDDAQPITTKK